MTVEEARKFEEMDIEWTRKRIKKFEKEIEKMRLALDNYIAKQKEKEIEELKKKLSQCEGEILLTNVEKVKEVIKEYYPQASLGIFNSRNLVGDPMDNIYNNGEVQVDICYFYEYFEVFGLTEEEFGRVKEYYNSLQGSDE